MCVCTFHSVTPPIFEFRACQKFPTGHRLQTHTQTLLSDSQGINTLSHSDESEAEIVNVLEMSVCVADDGGGSASVLHSS
ncbi:hypothetical protein A6R68_06644 [Neotoma lepida]|uniref:Uncharacterized protein n=1 Tax=Neotoma lepida TaxID=56216 RepID=A0A1A6GHP3_NEOLE|nr:hypothetical protein A6R68_06644 [Neotoma lepida]